MMTKKTFLEKKFTGKKFTKQGFFTKRYEYWLQASPLARRIKKLV